VTLVTITIIDVSQAAGSSQRRRLVPSCPQSSYSEQPQRCQTQQPTRRQLRLTIHPPTSKPHLPHLRPTSATVLQPMKPPWLAAQRWQAITISYDSSQQQAKRKILTGGLDGAVGLHHIGFGIWLAIYSRFVTTSHDEKLRRIAKKRENVLFSNCQHLCAFVERETRSLAI
jgi:hypothetical protein